MQLREDRACLPKLRDLLLDVAKGEMTPHARLLRMLSVAICLEIETYTSATSINRAAIPQLVCTRISRVRAVFARSGRLVAPLGPPCQATAACVTIASHVHTCDGAVR